jgi:excisionase family DNA binding protein
MPHESLQTRLTLHEVAEQLQVHISTVYRSTHHGVRGNRLRSFLVGGRRYVSADDLEMFLDPGDFHGCDSRLVSPVGESHRSYGGARQSGGDQ